MMVMGCTFWLTSCSAWRRSSPAKTTTEVAVAHLVILRLADVHENLRGGVVDVYGLQDGGTVVGDGDLPALAHGEEDLVHALGPSVDLTRSLMAIAPTKEARRRARPSPPWRPPERTEGPPLPIMLMVAVGCLSMMGEDRRKTEEAR